MQEKDQDQDQNAASSEIAQWFPALKALRNGWKIIVAGVALGALIGAGSMLVMPSVFQATAMISMAQVPSLNNDRSSPVIAVSNIEEPAFLLERLKIPSTYTPAAIEGCRLIASNMDAESMVRMISVGIPRSVGSVAILRIRAGTPEAAAQCATSLFEMIRIQQETMIKPLELDLQHALSALEKRLSDVQSEMRRAEKEGRYETFFFAKRDELLFLNQQIYALRRGIQRILPTQIVAPVYSPSGPVSPQSVLVLSAATLAGLFLGLLIVGVREYAGCRTASRGSQV